MKEKTVNLAKFCFKNTHRDQDKTETRLSKLEANKTRLRRDCPKNFHLRQDRDETSSKILYETKSFCTFSVKTEMRLSIIEANGTRLVRDCPKNFHPRQDRDKTSSKIQYQTGTESLRTFSLETETRPRLSSFTGENIQRQVETELGQAQLKLGFHFTLIFCTIKI